MPNTLAGTLLAIQQRRGALFMLDMSRSLIENWNLRCDRLQDQSAQTVQLVETLLNSSSLAERLSSGDPDAETAKSQVAEAHKASETLRDRLVVIRED